MAQWSEKRQEELKADRERARRAAAKDIVVERLIIFRSARKAGWIMKLLDPKASLLNGPYLPDDEPVLDAHVYVKIPNAHPVRVKSMAQLHRLTGGL